MANFRAHMGKDAKPANFVCVANRVKGPNGDGLDKDGKPAGWMVDYRLDTCLAGKNQSAIDKIRENGHASVQSDIHINHNPDGSVKADYLTDAQFKAMGDKGSLAMSPEGDKAIAFVSGTVAKGKNGYYLENIDKADRPFVPSNWDKAVAQAAAGLEASRAVKEYKRNQAEKAAEAEAPAVEAEAVEVVAERELPEGGEELLAKAEAGASVEMDSPEL